MSGVEVRSAGSSSSPQPGCRRAGESRWASPATRRRGVWPLFGARVAPGARCAHGRPRVGSPPAGCEPAGYRV